MENEGICVGEQRYMMRTSHCGDETDGEWSPTDFVPLAALHAGIVEETDEGVENTVVLNMAFICGKQ